MNSRFKRLIPYAVLLSGLGILTFVGVQLVSMQPEDYSPGEAGEKVAISITQGASLTEIAKTAQTQGIVATTAAFLAAAQANPKSKTIAPGDYLIATHLSAVEAIEQLLDPANRDQVRLLIKEGWTAKRTFEEIEKQFEIRSSDLNAAASAITWPLGADSAEGFLYPATYMLPRNSSASQILTTLHNRFIQSARTLDLETKAMDAGFTPMEILTIASIAQGESLPRDYEKVVRVIYNRLQIGMPLQMDSTVNYGLGTNTLRLTNKSIAVDTPYNTYLHKGLPKGPINSPNEEALRAALNPATGSWLYFVTTNPQIGLTEFATTYPEFLKLKAKYLRNRK